MAAADHLAGPQRHGAAHPDHRAHPAPDARRHGLRRHDGAGPRLLRRPHAGRRVGAARRGRPPRAVPAGEDRPDRHRLGRDPGRCRRRGLGRALGGGPARAVAAAGLRRADPAHGAAGLRAGRGHPAGRLTPRRPAPRR
ncbi:hypothetical protein SCOCK_280093 [Actinacidiphila cocklensis]|uniref:Uncharacterized protein n=1 Tax=Actinacidiphila cocklensis TaxID=887465 RepID=A0A9W4DNF4_9ACTN|nr:hypothetical protein SCOCK_280093 [Actinacidiphila cocklensis]